MGQATQALYRTRPVGLSDDARRIEERWLWGTTCHVYHVKREVLLEDEQFVLLRHGSHASYCGRFMGSRTCRAYTSLFRKVDLVGARPEAERNLQLGDGAIQRWEGRVSLKLVVAACRAHGAFREVAVPAEVGAPA